MDYAIISTELVYPNTLKRRKIVGRSMPLDDALNHLEAIGKDACKDVRVIGMPMLENFNTLLKVYMVGGEVTIKIVEE